VAKIIRIINCWACPFNDVSYPGMDYVMECTHPIIVLENGMKLKLIVSGSLPSCLEKQRAPKWCPLEDEKEVN
jgi:hypothetical protein